MGVSAKKFSPVPFGSRHPVSRGLASASNKIAVVLSLEDRAGMGYIDLSPCGARFGTNAMGVVTVMLSSRNVAAKLLRAWTGLDGRALEK